MVKNSIIIFFLFCSNLFAVDKLDLLELHNVARKSPLKMHLLLDQAAQDHADWMAKNNKCSHTGVNGSSPFDRIKKEYMTAGENVAAGQETPNEVVIDWLNSPGHKANIVNKRFKFAGFGIAISKNGTIYWCACFTD